MAKKLKRSNKRLSPLAGEERQLSLPFDWNSPTEDKEPVYDAAGQVIETGHACPGCGRNLKRWKGCWVCNGCGYSSCGEAE